MDDTTPATDPGRPDRSRAGQSRAGQRRPGQHRPGRSRPGRWAIALGIVGAVALVLAVLANWVPFGLFDTATPESAPTVDWAAVGLTAAAVLGLVGLAALAAAVVLGVTLLVRWAAAGRRTRAS